MPSPSEATAPSAILSVAIRNSEPVELEEFATSFKALADEYRNFIEQTTDAAVVPEVRLYIEEMRSGSIVADLQALAPLALPFVENATSVIAFAQYIRAGFDWLLGRAKGQAEPNRRTLENVCAFVEPVARDKASQLNIQGTINGDVIVNMHLTPVEANAVQNSARRALRPVRETIRGRHNRALLYLHQARNDPKSSVGDRGIIESIYPGPVRLVFADDGIKAQILESSENPFRVAYVVDVEVGTVNGRPLIYTVLELHDVIERPEAA